jgi:hypothetical protein
MVQKPLKLSVDKFGGLETQGGKKKLEFYKQSLLGDSAGVLKWPAYR